MVRLEEGQVVVLIHVGLEQLFKVDWCKRKKRCMADLIEDTQDGALDDMLLSGIADHR